MSSLPGTVTQSQATDAGVETVLAKPVGMGERPQQGARLDFIVESQGPETKATWGTPRARMWSEAVFVQQWGATASS